MSDNAAILMRRIGTKTEPVRKGWFGGFLGEKDTRVTLDGGLKTGEVLCLVSHDGEKAEIDEKWAVLCGQKEAPAAGEMLFAVLRVPFGFSMSIPAGEDADGHPWFFEVGGMLEIRDPAAFARTFRGVVNAETPLTSASFAEMLGTMPTTILHDKVLVDVLGVMSLEEKNGVDYSKRLNQEKGVDEKYVAAAVSEVFDAFFGEKETVAMRVTFFRTCSPSRDSKGENVELEVQKKNLEKGGVAAFEAFETLANALGDLVAENGSGTFAGLLQAVRRPEAGLKILAAAQDRRRRGGGVKLLKNRRTYGTRAIGSRGFVLTPTLKYGETLSSSIENGLADGYLTVLNVSERNEIVPMLPNEDFPDVRMAKGERILIGDENSDLIKEIREGAREGTDHLVAIISGRPLLDGPLPTLGEALSPAEADRLVAKIASLDDVEWSADVMSFRIFP